MEWIIAAKIVAQWLDTKSFTFQEINLHNVSTDLHSNDSKLTNEINELIGILIIISPKYKMEKLYCKLQFPFVLSNKAITECVCECASNEIYFDLRSWIFKLKRMLARLLYEEKPILWKREKRYQNQLEHERRIKTFFQSIICMKNESEHRLLHVKYIPYVIWNRILSHSIFVCVMTILKMIFVPFLLFFFF